MTCLPNPTKQNKTKTGLLVLWMQAFVSVSSILCKKHLYYRLQIKDTLRWILHRQAWVSSPTHMLPRAKSCYEPERKYSIRSVHSGRSWGNLTSDLVVSNNLARSCCFWWPLIKMLTQPIHTEKMNIQKRIACSWFQQYTQLQPQTDNSNKLYRNAALGVHPLTNKFWA